MSLLLYITGFIWLFNQDKARKLAILQSEKKDLEYFDEIQDETLENNYNHLTGGTIISLVLSSILYWISDDNLPEFLKTFEIYKYKNYDAVYPSILILLVSLILFSSFPGKLKQMVPLGCATVLGFVLTPYFFSIHEVDVTLQTALIFALIMTLADLNLNNFIIEGHQELNIYSKYKILFHLVLLMSFSLQTVLVLDMEKKFSILFGILIGLAVGLSCNLLGALIQKKKAKKIKKFNHFFFNKLNKYPIIYLVTIPLFFPVNLLFRVYPSLILRLLNNLSYLPESIENLFRYRSFAFDAVFEKRNHPHFFYLGFFLMPIVTVYSFQKAIALFNPTLAQLNLTIGVLLFLYFSFILPLYLYLYHQICLSMIRASRPEKLNYPWIQAFPEVYCSTHRITLKIERNAIFYRNVRCPVENCHSHSTTSEDRFDIGSLIGIIGGHAPNDSGYEKGLFCLSVNSNDIIERIKLPEHLKAKVEKLQNRTFLSRKELLYHFFSENNVLNYKFRPIIEKLVCNALPLWSEEDKKAINFDVREIKIIQQDGPIDYDRAITSVMRTLINDLNKSRDHLKKIKVKLIGNPKISDFILNKMKQEFKQVSVE